jgi:hypothetical protein
LTYISDQTVTTTNIKVRCPLVAVAHPVAKCAAAVKIVNCRQDVTEENIVKQLSTHHALVVINMPRLKGFCVDCIKRKNDPKYKQMLPKVRTYCPACPSGNWICEACFDERHLVANVD